MIQWRLKQRGHTPLRVAYVGKWAVGYVGWDGTAPRNNQEHWRAVVNLPMIVTAPKRYKHEEQAMSIVTAITKYWFEAAGLKLPIKRRKRVIGIVGTRRRDSNYDFRLVENEFLRHYHEGDTICSGLCSKGADRFAVILSEKYHASAKWYKADWQKHGKIAGFLRNTDIAKDSHILIACVAHDRKGGTEDTLRKFSKVMKKKNYYIV